MNEKANSGSHNLTLLFNCIYKTLFGILLVILILFVFSQVILYVNSFELGNSAYVLGDPNPSADGDGNYPQFVKIWADIPKNENIIILKNGINVDTLKADKEVYIPVHKGDILEIDAVKCSGKNSVFF